MFPTRTFVSAVLSFLFVSSSFCSCAQKSGFSIDLIHRDSPRSPFYNPDETSYELLVKACERSTTPVLSLDENTHLNASKAEITSHGALYLVNISLGTPSVNIIATVDTGSSFIWTQCKPCPHCFTQEAPLFEPKKSSTYKNVACSSPQCKQLGKLSSCGKSDPSCLYTVSYGDGSISKGNLAIDTVGLGFVNKRPLTFPNTVVGCGYNNVGRFNPKTSGVIGLGGGPLSLTSQLSKSIDGKFSYCLVPYWFEGKKTSRLNFGSQAVVSGNGAVSTSLIKGTTDTFYFINLKAISVGDKKMPYSGPASGTSKGNMVIDSGAPLTYLPSGVYSKLESAVSSAVVGKKVKSPQPFLSLCYDASSVKKIPQVTMHFDGADVRLTSWNVFVPVSNSVLCLAFGKRDDVAIYGNVAQANFLVGYDRKAGKLSFKPVDCSKV